MKIKIPYKLFLFGIAVFFGTALTFGNWYVGVIAGIIVVMSRDIQKKYE